MVQISTPLGWPLTGEWAPREALFVKLLWPLVGYYRPLNVHIRFMPLLKFKLTVCCFVDVLKLLCTEFEYDFASAEVVVKNYLLTYLLYSVDLITKSPKPPTNTCVCPVFSKYSSAWYSATVYTVKTYRHSNYLQTIINCCMCFAASMHITVGRFYTVCLCHSF